MKTPWGESQTNEPTGQYGVRWVTTGSHGGCKVSKHVAETLLSERARAIGFEEMGAWWFEEDCAYAAVVFEHPEWFVRVFGGKPAEALSGLARATLLRWNSEYFATPLRAHRF